MRRFARVLVAVAALLAVALLSLRGLLAVALIREGELLVHLRDATGLHVHATRITHGIDVLDPFLIADNVRFDNGNGITARIAQLRLEVDALGSLRHRALVFANASIHDVHVRLAQRDDGSWPLADGEGGGSSPLPTLLESHRLRVTEARVELAVAGQNPTLLQVALAADNANGQHQLSIDVGCGDGCGGNLAYTLADAEGLIPTAGSARLRLHGLPRIDNVLRTEAGVIDFVAAALAVDAQIEDGKLALAGTGSGELQLRGAQGQARVSLASALRLSAVDAAGDLEISSGSLAIGDHTLALDGTALAWRDTGTYVRLPRIDVGTLTAPLARTGVLPALATEWIDGLQPSVTIDNARLFRSADGRLAYAAEFEDLTMSAYRGAPKLVGVFAEVAGHANGGRLRLGPQAFGLAFPDVFREEFGDTVAQGDIAYWVTANQFALHSNDLVGSTAGARAFTARFALFRPVDRQQATITLLVDATDAPTDNVGRYLPNDLDPPLRNWLTSAIGDGRLERGEVFLHGYSAKQPVGKRTQVELRLRTRGVSLRFEPQWPPIEDLAADITISNGHLAATLARAAAGGIRVGGGSVSLPAGSKDLTLQASGTTGVEPLLAYLMASPVRQTAPFLEDWAGFGAMTFKLDANVPLDGRAVTMRVDGELRGTRLHNAALKLTFDDLAGSLHFEVPTLLRTAGLDGSLNGNRIRLAADTGDGAITFDARGAGSGQWLESWLPWPVRRGVSGAFDYSATLALPLAGEAPGRLQLTTDLAGFGMALPAPLNKPVDTTLPTTLVLTFDTATHLQMDVAGIAAAARIDRGNLRAAAIGIDGNARPLPAAGIVIAGNSPALDAIGWGALFGSDTSTGPGLTVTASDLRIETLPVGGLALNNVRFDVRTDTDGYHIDFAHAAMEGTFSAWRDQRPSLLAFARLQLPADPDIDADADGANEALVGPPTPPPSDAERLRDDPLADVDPLDVPPLALRVDNLYYGEDLVGAGSGQLTRLPDGVALTEVEGTLRNVRFASSTLSWQRQAGGTRTHFEGTLKAGDLATVLPLWGYAASVDSDSAELASTVSWTGSPAAFALRALEGTSTLAVRKGRFIQVDGNNALRLLGIFDFATIARRARLDFADVFSSGVSFDSVDAGFSFGGGQLAFAPSGRVTGPGSAFQIGGTIDLWTGALANELIVTVPLTRAVPWYAAYAALSNPLTGAGLLVAERLLRDQLNKLSSAKYLLGGTLDEPTIELVGIINPSLEPVPAPPPEPPATPPATANVTGEP